LRTLWRFIEDAVEVYLKHCGGLLMTLWRFIEDAVEFFIKDMVEV
jgi:hypothetical protein